MNTTPRPDLPLAFREFLRAAKTATYAAQGDDASTVPALADTKQLEYCSGPYLYRDIYAGLYRFVGQEMVYHAGKVVWSMSYAGGLIDGVVPAQAKPVYAFLRHALQSVGTALPLRGPSRLHVNELAYTCDTQGSLARFRGIESISQGNARLYELWFSGGTVA